METKENSKQNVIVIVCDQLRADFLGAYGADFIPTPNIDALAANGVTFDNAITAATVCGPARASMLTGLTVSGHDSYTNYLPCRDGVEYIPQRMRDAGYITAGIGCSDHKTIEYDYKRWYMNEYYKELEDKNGEIQWESEDGLHFNYPEEDFYDRWSADKAIEFIDIYTKTGKAPNGATPKEDGAPFFMYCGFVSPHTPLLPPQEIIGRVDKDKLPRVRTTKRFMELPDVERNRMAFLTDTDALKDPESIVERRMDERLSYAELIVEVDDLVGRIVDSLKENGIYENTTIIFTADHGSVDNDYNLVSKGPWPYKEQLFIPMIVSNHPRLEKGTHCDSLCGNLDIGATALDVAGDERAFGISRSLIGTAEGTIPEREVNMSEFCDSCKTLVDKRFTFTYYPFTGRTCLYDRIADPDETTDLGGNPEYADVERKFLMHVIDFLALSKPNGVRYESHDLLPSIQEGIKKKHPKFLEKFEVAYPISNETELERIKLAGLPNDYNDFCYGREVVIGNRAMYEKKK